jgi:hypothetical protein
MIKYCCHFKNSFIRSELTFSSPGGCLQALPDLTNYFLNWQTLILSFQFYNNPGFVYGEI